jgi:sporulation protein YlmC with PRC-barrel domain
MRTIVFATLAHALLFVTAPALAQDQTNPPAPPTPASTATTPPTTTQTIPTLLGSKITGLKLYDKNGEQIGSVKDILVTGDRVQQYVIAIGGSVAGFGEKTHVIEPSKVSFENDVKGNLQAKIALSKDEVQQLAEYKY